MVILGGYYFKHTVVPALGDPRRERTPAMYGHVINVPTHFNVKLPAIGGHLPNANSHLLVVRICYNGQFKQMPCFRRSFQPKIARGGHPNLRPTFCSKFNVHAAIGYRTFWPGSDSARKNMDVSAKSMDVSAKEYRRFGQRRWTFRPKKMDVSARKGGRFGQKKWTFRPNIYLIVLRNGYYY